MKEKDRFEILLEEIKGDVKLVLENYSTLDNKVDTVKEELKQDINGVKHDVAGLNNKIDHVHDSLKNEISTTFKMLDYELKEHIRVG